MSYRTPATDTLPYVYVAFNNHVVALHRDTGERAWQKTVGAYSPRIHADGMRVFLLGTWLICVDAATGNELWEQTDAKGDTLLVDGERLFVGGNGAVRCYSASDGSLLWGDTFKGMGLGKVAIAVDGKAAQIDRNS